MDPSTAERRRGDRRRNDRRAAQGRRRDDSAASTDNATQAPVADGPRADSFFDPGWLAAGDAPVESRLALHEARRAAREQESALARVFRTYAAARALIGLGLVAVHGLGGMLGMRSSEALALVSVLYAVQAITLWVLPRFGAWTQPQAQRGRRRQQWLFTIGIDLLAFTLLYMLEAGATFNYAALLVLPVLMAGVLSTRLSALATAAGVALMLLLVAWHAQRGADAPGLMLQSGLAGLGLFMITLLAGELASRLTREELAARGSRELARQQAQLNRLVIQEMADGVLVVDRELRVRAANPAARALLVDQGLSAPAPFALRDEPGWSALLQATEQALAAGAWPEAGRDVLLRFSTGHSRTLRLRVRFMRSQALAWGADPKQASADPAHGEPFAVLLIEDLRTLQARIRQEKLAAMGRVSAGIAHEIRNPLAAIAQANALMLEDNPAPAQQRLMQMVADNVERLKRLVDDVMEVAPAADPSESCIDARAAVAQIVADWSHTTQLSNGSQGRLRLELPEAPLGVRFDPEHLRRVLVNLLDNALRHASAQPGAIFLRLTERDEHGLELSVFSDGPAIAPEVERHLFEPFFSTRSRGSGLGLYICRELCERWDASIDYQPRPAAERLRNQFVVLMARCALPGAAPPEA